MWHGTKIIAITGRKGSGKTTLANNLVMNGYTHRPFAAPIKVMLAELIVYQGGTTSSVSSYLYGELKDTPCPYFGNRTPRHAMQTLGTEWRDMLSRSLWTEIWLRHTKNHSTQDVVVDDLRFIHEEAAVRELGGKIIRTVRPGLPNDDIHPSETEQDNIVADLTVINDGQKVHMFNRVRHWLSKLDNGGENDAYGQTQRRRNLARLHDAHGECMAE